MPRCARVGVPPTVPGAQRSSSHAALGPGPGAQGRTAGPRSPWAPLGADTRVRLASWRRPGPKLGSLLKFTFRHKTKAQRQPWPSSQGSQHTPASGSTGARGCQNERLPPESPH